MIPIVLHIPHASQLIPAECVADFIVSRPVLDEHLARSTDHFTDDLFEFDGDSVARIRFPVSRLVVDPERFEDDAREVMAAKGLGVLYERGHDGSRLRNAISGARRAWYLDRWYRPHHAALEIAVDTALERSGRVLIVDCHSYPDDPLTVDLDRTTPRPDSCVGTSGLHTPSWLVEAATGFAAQNGWSMGVDQPYAGSIVPMKYLGSTTRVMSLMIELNRKRYMTLDGNQAKRSQDFGETRAFVHGLLGELRSIATCQC